MSRAPNDANLWKQHLFKEFVLRYVHLQLMYYAGNQMSAVVYQNLPYLYQAFVQTVDPMQRNQLYQDYQQNQNRFDALNNLMVMIQRYLQHDFISIANYGVGIPVDQKQALLLEVQQTTGPLGENYMPTQPPQERRNEAAADVQRLLNGQRPQGPWDGFLPLPPQPGLLPQGY